MLQFVNHSTINLLIEVYGISYLSAIESVVSDRFSNTLFLSDVYIPIDKKMKLYIF